ncbi:MAG: lytic transglycosylase domain-containing protein [Pseudorhodobacter sp.]|nr:lytic transglycosylase domain-containing protein [Pseudorhodobacter sp.]
MTTLLLGCFSGLGGVVPSAMAQPQPYQDDFTARRVGVPKPGETRRITVQIDPVEQARRLAVAPKPEAKDPAPEASAPVAAPPLGRYDWYWQAVPAGLTETSGRYSKAISALGLGPAGTSVEAPRLQQMQDLATLYGIEILKATIGTRVSPALVLAVIGIESAGEAAALSSAGAVGLMQLIPAKAERFGVVDSTDPVQNIKGGVAYLNWLMERFDQDPVLVLAAYNAGEGAVSTHLGVPPFAETRDYVPKVLAAWTVAQGLCLTPPELVSDPCVFKVIAAGG